MDTSPDRGVAAAPEAAQRGRLCGRPREPDEPRDQGHRRHPGHGGDREAQRGRREGRELQRASLS